MNGDVEVGVIGQQAQANVEDAHALALNENIEAQVQVSVEDEFALTSNENNEEQVQANVDGGETFVKVDIFKIEIELRKTIDMI